MALDAAGDVDEPCAHHDLAKAFERLGPDDEIGDAGFVLDGHEDDALGGARPLAHQHDAGDRDAAAVLDSLQLGAGAHPLGAQAFPQEAHRMGFEGQPGRLVIGDDMLGEGHERKLHGWL